MAKGVAVIDEYEGFSFRKVLKEYVENRQPKEYSTLSPSGLGHCARSQIFRIAGVEMTTPPEEAALINFQVGFAWETIIKDALEAQGIKHDFQVPLKSEKLNLSGTADFLIHLPQGILFADAKTMRSQWFWYLANTNKDFLKENEQYALQLGAYMLMAKEMGMDVFRGQIPFISKDDGMIWREVGVNLTPELEQKITERCNYLNRHLKEGTLPPCECEGWKVGYCSFGDPLTREKNRAGKLLNTSCCDERLWDKRKEAK